MRNLTHDEQTADSPCLCPECTGPSEPIPPEGLIELHPFGCVVCWDSDGRIKWAMHPFAFLDMMEQVKEEPNILKTKGDQL